MKKTTILENPLKNIKESHGKILTLFPLESLQNLDDENAKRCQSILGHGDVFGIWITPESMIPHLERSYRHIDLRKRIASYLVNEASERQSLEILLDEGVLWLTRIGLLMRLGPAGTGRIGKLKPLDASTVAFFLHQPLAKLVARGIDERLKVQATSSPGFACVLTAETLNEWYADKYMRPELNRLKQLHDLNLWNDKPPLKEFKGKTTPVRGPESKQKPQKSDTPFIAIPDEYLAQMGPKVLWLIKDLGPNLIHLLESFSTILESGKTSNKIVNRQVNLYFKSNIWRDRNQLVIEKLPFEMKHATVKGNHMRKDPNVHNPSEWPPRHWDSIRTLAASLQSAHMWITLLVMAARIGEVATLKRNCIEFAHDGQLYANGRTFKPSRALTGKEREWPVPDILVDVIAQQIKLVEASETVGKIMKDSGLIGAISNDSNHLWASLGTSSSSDPTEKLLTFGTNLQALAKRFGLTPKPGGRNLHPHRFRKTLARLAGLAIDGSQKVLMQLLGHDDVTTTLGYMQSDPSFAKEVDDITRELRIMRGESLIEDMRAAISNPIGTPFGGHGGGGAPVLLEAVRTYVDELHRTGQEWGVDTARELSVLLTNNGESARLINAHVVCTKTAGEVGMCSGKKGAIDAGNCQTECRNHIEEKTGRRDTERVIPILVQHAQAAISNNDWLPFQRDKKQLEQELKRYDDIGQLWRGKPEVQAILGAKE